MALNANLIFFAAALLLASVYSFPCKGTLDCDDENPNTVDVCLLTGMCLNIDPSNKPGANDSEPFFVTKEEFIDAANKNFISIPERKKILKVMALFLAEFNPHRFVHLNLLKFDPARALNALSKEVEELSTADFHEAVTHIFQQMDDLHTNYIRPSPFAQTTAFLGFQMKRFFDPINASHSSTTRPSARYVVTDVTSQLNFSDDSFVRGVEVLEWNDVIIGEAVRAEGDVGYGSNIAAQKARGLDDLLERGLATSRIPDDDFVKVTFRNLDGEIRTIFVPWRYVFSSPESNSEDTESEALTLRTVDGKPRMKHPDLDYAMKIGRLPRQLSRVQDKRETIPVDPRYKTNFAAEIIETEAAGPIGRLVLFDFPVPTVEMLEEYVRILSLFPQNGLIVDLRGNNGGLIALTKFLIELMSDVEVPDFPTSIRATHLMERFVFANDEEIADTEEAKASLEQFRQYGSALSTARAVGEPFTGPLDLNLTLIPEKVPRVYSGPVIVVSDGRTYSSGDIFSMFTKDSGFAELIGIGDSTGAGGANVLQYSQLQPAFPGLLEELPIDFRSSFARYFRTGANAGEIVENFGIEPDIRYFITKRDVLEGDCDLFEFLARRLASGSEPQASPDVEESPEFELL